MISVCVAEMGDKTQLFVIGLAAKRRVRDVLIGITIATVLLNAMGVFMGNVISKMFPVEYVGIAAGFFFLVFALLTIGKNENGEGAKGKSIIGISVAFFVAELGDKTQLSSIAFSASDPGNAIPIFLGAVAGMLIADSVGILISKLLNKKIPEGLMKLVAYSVFTAFGFKTVFDNFYLFLPDKTVHLLSAIGLLYTFFSCVLLRDRKKEKLCKK